MEIKVSIEDVSLADVVAVAYDSYEEKLETRTLGEEITGAILDRMAADATRWKSLTERFEAVIDKYLRTLAPAHVENLVAREVNLQLTSRNQGAVANGGPSTKAEAYVSTEVTTQLRAAFAPVVARHLASLDKELRAITAEITAKFRRK